MSLPSDQFASGRLAASASYSGAASPASSFMSTDETDAAFALTALANAAAAMPQVSSPNGKTTGMTLAATAAVTPSPPTVPTPTCLSHVGSHHSDDEMAAALTWAKTHTHIPEGAEDSDAKPAPPASSSASKKSGGKSLARRPPRAFRQRPRLP